MGAGRESHCVHYILINTDCWTKGGGERCVCVWGGGVRHRACVVDSGLP